MIINSSARLAKEESVQLVRRSSECITKRNEPYNSRIDSHISIPSGRHCPRGLTCYLQSRVSFVFVRFARSGLHYNDRSSLFFTHCCVRLSRTRIANFTATRDHIVCATLRQLYSCYEGQRGMYCLCWRVAFVNELWTGCTLYTVQCAKGFQLFLVKAPE